MNQDVTALLETLRETPLAWIADEIENEIAVGQLVEKTYTEPGQTRQRTATTVQDYNDKEQLEITLHCLSNYLLVTPLVWQEAVKSLRKRVKTHEANMGQVMITDPAGQAFTPFTADYEEHAQRLYRLLREAWPGGGPEFDLQFQPPADDSK